MKTWMGLALVALLSLPVLAGEPKKGGKDMKDAKGGETETVTFPVLGMMCNNCVAAVTQSFEGAEGVTDAKPDMGKDLTVVTFVKGKTDVAKILAHFNSVKQPRFTAAKPGDKVSFNYSDKPETLSGRLAIKAKDAPGEVVCRINSRRNGEPADRWFNVIAKGDAAKQIENLRNAGLGAKLTGIVSDKGIEVTKVEN